MLGNVGPNPMLLMSPDFALKNLNLEEVESDYNSLNEIPVTDLMGKKYKRLGDLVGKCAVYLVVNVASEWDITDVNYKQLVQIHKDYQDRGF